MSEFERHCEVDGDIYWISGKATPRCVAVHPTNGRRCEDGGKHPWSHSYVEHRLDTGRRVWWTDGGWMRDMTKLQADLDAVKQMDLFGGAS